MSKIEVNTIEPQCGTTVTVGKCTSTVAVPGNVVKSNALQASDGGVIISQSGTTVTLGASGDTVALASGASQTGFGRTGTVDWITTPKVTGDSPVTGVSGSGYFLNTTAGTITINLPAGSGGDIVSMADYAATWQTNNVTVTPNGSEKIGGVADDAILDTEGQSVTFVYVDSTQGWINTMDSTSNVRGLIPYLVATGGTPCSGAIDGDYKVHTFTGPGTLCVSNAGTPAGSNTVDYMVVAGGGGGGAGCAAGGAGGAGGMRYSYPNPATGGHPVSVQGYPITVGGGGAKGSGCVPQTCGTQGASSVFDSITSAGGGYGGKGESYPNPGGTGGSGGGASRSGASGGAGNTPSSPCTQGTAGGDGSTPNAGGGGGGGKSGVGSNGGPGGGGNGGAGTTLCISGSPTAYAGGGGGGSYPAPSKQTCGGAGGGGKGAPSGPPLSDMDGADNTGGGGGGGSEGPLYGTPTNDSPGGTGGSGTVIIRYKFQ